MDNRYLKDRAARRQDMRMRRDRMRDERDRYSDHRRNYGRDREMDRHNSYPERMGRMYDRDMSDYRGQDYHMGYEYSRESRRPMDYDMAGHNVGGNRPMYDGYDRRDYYDHYDRKQGYEDFGSSDVEKEWHDDLEEWMHKLKKHDRFNMNKEDIINKAKQMGVKFDRYDEKEFATTYYMMVSDYKSASNDPHFYLALAKQWLEDEDTALTGSEKLCAYYYEIVKGEE